VPSHEVGLAILGPLRDLDEVAYLRFASVYRGFESLADFEEEIAALRAEHLSEWRPEDVQFLASEAGLPPDRDRGTGTGLPTGQRATRQRGQEPAPAS
jgi:transcriptional repressor NrdR